VTGNSDWNSLKGEIHKLATRYKTQREARMKEAADLKRLTFNLKDLKLESLTADEPEREYEKWKVSLSVEKAKVQQGAGRHPADSQTWPCISD
jgi:hypothetical protein